jgi:hypothetical protein
MSDKIAVSDTWIRDRGVEAVTDVITISASTVSLGKRRRAGFVADVEAAPNF